MSQKLDLAGVKCKQLTFIRYLQSNSHGKAMWLCHCDCGNEKVLVASNVLNGRTSSCGCSVLKHGRSGTPEYKIWDAMIQRCENPKAPAFKNYGARGIKVCPRWRSAFAAFFADMGERPIGLEIERINNDGNYEPGNCKWATRKEQCNNYRWNHFIDHAGMRLTVTQWARSAGFEPETFRRRLRAGWSMERALSERIDTSKWSHSHASTNRSNLPK